MIKQFVILICASVAAIFFKDKVVHGLNLLMFAYNQTSAWMAMIFSGDHLGQVIQGVVSLIVVPSAMGGVLCAAHWIVKKDPMPHTLTVIWTVWTILLTAILAQLG